MAIYGITVKSVGGCGDMLEEEEELNGWNYGRLWESVRVVGDKQVG